MEFDEDLMIPDKSLSINQGAITAMGWQSCTDKTSFSGAILNALAKNTISVWIPRLKIIRRRSMIFNLRNRRQDCEGVLPWTAWRGNL